MQVMEGIVPFFPYGDREAALQTLAGILERGPFALPPETPNGRQFGTTLKFHIDLFVDGIEDTLEPTKVIRHLNQSLKLAIEMYKISVK